MSQYIPRPGLADTPKRTPAAPRSYLNPHHSPNNFSGTHSPQPINETNSMTSEESGCIFGTNISTKKARQTLENFIEHFEVIKITDNDSIPEKIYLAKFNDLEYQIEKPIFEVCGSHLKEYDRELYMQFIYFPAQMISCFDAAIISLYEKHFIQTCTDQDEKERKKQRGRKLMGGITHLDEITSMRTLSPKEINRLVSFRGIVIRVSDIYPEMKQATFKCSNCKKLMNVKLENAKVEEPKQCRQCNHKNCLELIHNLCSFSDKQFIKFQQFPECVPEGQTPSSITMIGYDTNVQGMKPGDRVEVIGIYRVKPNRVMKNKNVFKSLYGTYLDLISFRVIEENRYQSSAFGKKKIAFSDDQKNKFAEMAEDPNIIKNLINSFGPSIYGHEQIKKGLLAQLFSGTKKDFNQHGRSGFRSDINVLLIGDPSTAKSQMLQQVYNIVPRGIYTSGRGSSAVGLTANVRKDPETKQFILESGALVLSDLGICCIDQFDKMDQNSQIVLLQAMEQQTISIAKAGIVCSLNSRTAILAAANPIHSRYNPKKTVIDNINLPHPLLTRFDLIYLMLDQPKQKQDKLLATHILNLYSNAEMSQVNKPKYDRQILTKYITFAREYVSPKITQQAGKRLTQRYVQMRKMGNSKRTVTASTRQLESMIRISQSFAKMRLSDKVTVQDVEQAVELIKVATQQAATDPTTGLIDMDMIMTGKGMASKQRQQKIAHLIKSIIEANVSKYESIGRFDDIAKDVRNQWTQRQDQIQDKDIVEALKILQTQKEISILDKNKLKPKFKLARSYD